MASVEPVRISVACEFGDWQTKCDGIISIYDSEAAAIAGAIDRAHVLGREGRFAFVVMRTLTSVYGPTGLIRTLPTRGRPNAQQPESLLPEQQVPALAEPAPATAPLALEANWPKADHPAEPVREPENALPAEIVADEPERQPRVMRIVAALARETEGKLSSGRSFHEKVTRLARSRKLPPLRW
jgi:hypothetical protein